MTTSSNILLPISFDQLMELIKSLSPVQKQHLIDILEKDDGNIPEWQKKEVNKRIEKYSEHPELMVSENAAITMINKI